MSSIDIPIANVDRFDVVGVRKDCGVDAVVSCLGPLDDSKQTLWLLGSKARNYLQEIQSEGFSTEHGPGPVRIFISCGHDVSGPASALIESLRREASAEGVELQLVRQVA